MGSAKDVFYPDYEFTELECQTLDTFFYTMEQHAESGRVQMFFSPCSEKEQEKINILLGLAILGRYIIVPNISGCKSFNPIFSPTSLSTVGVKFLVILQTFMEKLGALICGLHWCDNVTPIFPKDIVNAAIWDTNNSKDLIILNETLQSLIDDLQRKDIRPRSAYQTPPSKTTIITSTPESWSQSLDCAYNSMTLFHIYVIRSITYSLLERSYTSRLRIHNVSHLFVDHETFPDQVVEYLHETFARYH